MVGKSLSIPGMTWMPTYLQRSDNVEFMAAATVANRISGILMLLQYSAEKMPGY